MVLLPWPRTKQTMHFVFTQAPHTPSDPAPFSKREAFLGHFRFVEHDKDLCVIVEEGKDPSVIWGPRTRDLNFGEAVVLRSISLPFLPRKEGWRSGNATML